MSDGRARHAILVDAGYLVSAAAQVIVGTSLRTSISVGWESLVDGITTGVADITDTELLRVYWYDAASPRLSGFSDAHSRVSLLSDVKLRLGRVSHQGAQKGVDTRIALDMVHLALRGSVSEIYLVSGDDDLTEAVEMAQEYGVRVNLFNIPDPASRLGIHGTALNLARSVDARHSMSRSALDAAISRATRQVVPPAVEEAHPQTVPSPLDLARRHHAVLTSNPPNPPAYSTETGRRSVYAQEHVSCGDDDLRPYLSEVASKVVEAWLATAVQSDVNALNTERPTIPEDLDRTLLTDLVARGDDRDRVLETETRFELRKQFWAEVDRQSS